MRPTAKTILDHLHEPEALEALYRQDPEAFQSAFQAALAAAPDSETLRVWQARLAYRRPARRVWSGRGLWQAAAIGLAAGASLRLPVLWLSELWYYPRFGPMLMVLSLAAYFLLQRPDRRRALVGGALTLIAAVYVSLLPDDGDSVLVAFIHLPLVFWFYLGAVFLGDSWRDPQARCRFLRYSGEVVVVGTLVSLGGMVLSGLTLGLYSFVAGDLFEWYFRNVAVFGLAAIPVVATFVVDVVFERRSYIAGMLARIFTPLFLLMVAGFLLFALTSGRNPFLDRSFLIDFNTVLLLVLGITVYSLVSRGREEDVGLFDYLNLALVVVTLIVDGVALSAILFRLVSFGLTPNRVVVLGANILIFIHLVWLGVTHLRLLKGRVGLDAMERAIGAYLPAYGLWAVLVTFLLPALFRFS